MLHLYVEVFWRVYPCSLFLNYMSFRQNMDRILELFLSAMGNYLRSSDKSDINLQIEVPQKCFDVKWLF